MAALFGNSTGVPYNLLRWVQKENPNNTRGGGEQVVESNEIETRSGAHKSGRRFTKPGTEHCNCQLIPPSGRQQFVLTSSWQHCIMFHTRTAQWCSTVMRLFERTSRDRTLVLCVQTIAVLQWSTLMIYLLSSSFFYLYAQF